MERKIQLYVAKNVTTSTYFTISLPLFTIYENKNAMNWYYENFINVYMDKTQNPCFCGMSFEMIALYNSIFDYKILKVDDIANEELVNRLKSELYRHKNYCFIYLDEYYISSKENYRKRHFYHESLIYGYDDIREVFLAIAFNYGKFSFLEYKYSDVKLAYISSHKYATNGAESISIIFFKLKQNLTYVFNLKKVKESLLEYINACAPKNLQQLQCGFGEHTFNYNGNCVFGADIVLETIKCLEEKMFVELDFYDFRRIHFLYEHANILVERFEYIKSIIDYENTLLFEKAINKYRGVVNKLSNIRLLSLKLRLNNKLIDYKKKVEQLCKSMHEVYIEEKIVLSQVLDVLQCFLKDNQNELESQIYDTLHLETQIEGNLIIGLLRKPTYIKSISVNQLADIKVYIDDELANAVFYKNAPSSEVINISINRFAKSNIKLITDMAFELPVTSLNAKFYGGNLCNKNRLLSSSVWVDEKTNKVSIIHTPDKAVENNKLYWRAAAQRYQYKQRDWLKLLFDEPERINTIVIGELDFSPRLKKYRISYFDELYIEHEIVTAIFNTGVKNVQQFPCVSAKAIKIDFLECSPDSNGFCEPIVNLLEVYCSE